MANQGERLPHEEKSMEHCKTKSRRRRGHFSCGIVKPNPAGEEGTSTRASTAQTRDRDEQALGIIITSLDDAYIHYIDDASTAQQAWGILEYMFRAKGKRSKIGLKMQLY